MSRLLVLAPLGVEAMALRIGLRGAGRVVRVGMGPARAAEAARRVAALPGDAVVVAGLCGAVDPDLRPGDVVVASALVLPDGSSEPCLDAGALARHLRSAGLRVVVGPIAGVERISGREARAALAGSAAAVDMESPWLAPAAAGRPFAVARVVVDTSDRRLLDPRTLPAGVRALFVLGRAGRVLRGWSPR
ncbi:MAG: hypothetical protein ACKVUT_10040 [Gaiella sp.]